MAPAVASRYKVVVRETQTTLPPKKDVARALLLKGSLFVHLDPRRSGVSVPPWLSSQPQLVLQVGLDMQIPIPDLRVDDTGVYGTLSFQRSPFNCTVPWSAVFALVGDDGRGMVWPEDLPPEIASEVQREAGRQKLRESRDARRAREQARDEAQAQVEAAVARADAEASAEEAETPPSGSPRKPARKPRELPPYLRVIK